MVDQLDVRRSYCTRGTRYSGSIYLGTVPNLTQTGYLGTVHTYSTYLPTEYWSLCFALFCSTPL